MNSTIRYPALFAAVTLLLFALSPAKAFSQDPDFYIFLAFGQSNMEGFPGVEAQDKTNVNSRFQLLPAVDWPDRSRTKGTWTTAVPPLCRGNGPGLCPCDYFGRTLVDSLPANIKIGIINVSVAGCAIEMFDKDKYQSYISGQAQWMKDIVTGYAGNPYERLVEMGKAAQKDGVVKGFLLHQGESGSTTGQWANEVRIIYNNLIKDLSLDSTRIPLLAGDLVNSSSMVKNLPSTLKSAHVVSSQGLQNRGDGLHFNPQGYRDFGKRYADTMLRILRKQVATGAPKSIGRYASGSGVYLTAGRSSVSFHIPRRDFVTLKAFSPGGKELAVLADADYAAGSHTIALGRKTLPPGAIILRLTSGSVQATRTILSCVK